MNKGLVIRKFAQVEFDLILVVINFELGYGPVCRFSPAFASQTLWQTYCRDSHTSNINFTKALIDVLCL